MTGSTDIQRIKRDGKTGGFLTFEGFEPLESDLKLLDVFYDLGLRMASLTHSRRNFFADGTQMGVKTGGLSKPGQQAVRRMNELGIVIDLAHLNPAGCWEVLERSEAPVVLSHTSPRRYFPDDAKASPLYPDIVDDRSRALLDAIAANGGVVGIIAYNQPRPGRLRRRHRVRHPRGRTGPRRARHRLLRHRARPDRVHDHGRAAESHGETGRAGSFGRRDPQGAGRELSARLQGVWV